MPTPLPLRDLTARAAPQREGEDRVEALRRKGREARALAHQRGPADPVYRIARRDVVLGLSREAMRALGQGVCRSRWLARGGGGADSLSPLHAPLAPGRVLVASEHLALSMRLTPPPRALGPEAGDKGAPGHHRASLEASELERAELRAIVLNNMACVHERCGWRGNAGGLDATTPSQRSISRASAVPSGPTWP